MRAVRIHEYGGPEVLRLEDVPLPTMRPRDLLIEVHASSVNPVDWKIRSGSQRGAIRLQLPWVLGMDLSGVVLRVGEEVTRFRPGDEVWSTPTHKRAGTYAELCAIDEAQVALKPTNLSHVEAASVPLVGLTAWDCLVDAARVRAGQKVLVQAGAGGVGTIAIQLAKHLGAYVAATCSARNADFVRDLGADRVVDYKAERFDEVLSGYDVVVESLGGEYQKRALAVLRRGGHLASINGGLPEATEKYGPNLGVAMVGLQMLGAKLGSRLRRNVKTSIVVRRPDGDNLARLTTLFEQGAIRPVVGEIFALDRIADAHRASEAGHARGKIVVAVKR